MIPQELKQKVTRILNSAETALPELVTKGDGTMATVNGGKLKDIAPSEVANLLFVAREFIREANQAIADEPVRAVKEKTAKKS